jgi:hypothetical protein
MIRLPQPLIELLRTHKKGGVQQHRLFYGSAIGLFDRLEIDLPVLHFHLRRYMHL